MTRKVAFDEVLPFYQKSVQFTPPNTDYRAPNASADYDINAPLYCPG
jgi:choline dehydrogenase